MFVQKETYLTFLKNILTGVQFLISVGKEFHNLGAQTENALSMSTWL